MSAGHTELLIVLAISFAIQISGLVILGFQLYDSRKMVAESQRLTRAVGALVIQESDKIRQIFPR
ncbi:MAG: hypothetical protein HYU41_11105 [Candidatus Rokubacteria bacterium]|nr:hypothetical protein [Candidatus Rokubacteria bacterium]